MENRRDYEMALAVIGEVVREWDPYCLLSEGAPADEFDTEIAKLATFVPKIHSAGDAAKAISSVFAEAFEPQYFSKSDCAQPGKELFAKLLAAGLIRA